MAKRKLYDENGNEVKGKLKKPFYKKIWFWVLVVILIGIFGSMGSGDDENTPDSADKTEEKQSEATKNDSEEQKEDTYGIGDTVSVGDMQYTVNKVETGKEVGPSVLPTTAGDTFLIVDLTVKNNGNEAVTVDSSFFKLKEGDKTFEADTDASMSANQNDDGEITNSFFLQSLNPDVEMTGKVVFDVTEAQANSETNQLQVSTGAWGTEQETINLQ